MNSTEQADLDRELWEAVCRDDESAFELLVRRHQAAVCAVAYNACGNLSLSEDVSQETFWIAWRDRLLLKEPARLRAWLCGIARNVARNSVRRSANAATPLDGSSEPSCPTDAPADEVVSREEEALVWQALEQIPETYREPMILFYREDQSVADVAATLDLSPDAVKQRLSRGRSLLRDQVLQIVEGTLRRSKPGGGFTVGVMAGLTSVAVGSKPALAGSGMVGLGAGAGIAGAKVAPAATAAAMSGVFGGLLGTAGGILGGWLGTWIPAQLAPTNRERERILSTGRRMSLVCLALIVFFMVVMIGFGRDLTGWRLAMVIIGWIVCFQSYIAVETLLLMKAIQRIRRDTDSEQDPNTSAFKSSIEKYSSQWEGRTYRSSASFLGVPLVDIQVSNPSPDGVSQPPKTARGWIAMGDRANGILLAIGGIAKGGIAIGGMSVGLISLGGVSLGIVSAGGLALGALALGGLSIGGIAFGGGAIGWQAAGGGALAWDVAAGGGAFAHHAAFGGLAMAQDYAVGGSAYADHANDALARSVIESHWIVKAMNGYVRHAGWVQAVVILMCILPSLVISRCLYRKKRNS